MGDDIQSENLNPKGPQKFHDYQTSDEIDFTIFVLLFKLLLNFVDSFFYFSLQKDQALD